MAKKKQRTKYVSKGQRVNVDKELVSQMRAERTPAQRMRNKLLAALKVPEDKLPAIVRENNWCLGRFRNKKIKDEDV